VRENCTPGSVRGAPGNGRPYRDDERRKMTDQRVLITKLDAARRQLDTAIQLFFANGDFVSIHALAYAAYTLTRNLCDKTNNPASFTRWVKETIVPEQHEQLFAALSTAGNFFKHADRDPKRQLEYIPEQYDVLLILAVWMYEAITRELTTPMSVFKIWYFLHHPGWCVDAALRPTLPAVRGKFPESRGEFFDVVSKGLRMAQQRIIELGVGR
jgi:hypothetical protein